MNLLSRCRTVIRLGLIVATLLTLPGMNLQPAYAQETNLALGMSVTRSSDCSCGRATSAVDGNIDTYWQPLSADRTDDLSVWLRVDLGAPASIERAVLSFRGGTADILEFRIRQPSRSGRRTTSWSRFEVGTYPFSELGSSNTCRIPYAFRRKPRASCENHLPPARRSLGEGGNARRERLCPDEFFVPS